MKLLDRDVIQLKWFLRYRYDPDEIAEQRFMNISLDLGLETKMGKKLFSFHDLVYIQLQGHTLVFSAPFFLFSVFLSRNSCVLFGLI